MTLVPPYFFFLPVHKGSGPTSHDIVARVRRVLPRRVKVGHTGTLDPFATGVMILAIGKATRFSDDVHQLDKSYVATLQLGRETDSLDVTGTVTREMPVPDVADDDLERVSRAFTGRLDQVPPALSAKKVSGTRAYRLARRNRAPELAPCRIDVKSLRLTSRSGGQLGLEVICSTGTYVRALARDIGHELGTCAHLIELTRTAVGSIGLADCLPDDELSPNDIQRCRRPVTHVLPWIERVRLDASDALPLLNGAPVIASRVYPDVFLAQLVRGKDVVAEVKCRYEKETRRIAPRIMCWSSEAQVK